MRKIVCYALVAFCLGSCANDDTNSGSGSATTPLSIASVSLGGLQTKSTTPAVGTTMGVFRLTGTGDYTTSQDNFSYTLGAGGLWAPTVTTSQILLGPKAATLCAYLPYNASATLTAVPLVSQIDGTANDVCYKNNITASASSPAVTFDMQHALSKITFTISPAASYTGTCAISNITIAGAGILKNSSLNLQTGVYTNESTPTGSVSFNPAIAGITSGNSATASVLMVPVTTAMSGTITLTINVDGTNKTASFNASLLPILAAGSNYNIPVTIATAMTVGSVSTVDWSSVAVPGTGNLQQETANSYMVAPSASLTISVNVKGNGESTSAALASLSTTHTAASVGVVWQTTSGLVTCTNFDATSQTVIITAGSTSGNAVIAAYASDGTTILWSWHIWVTNYNPNTQLNGTTYTYTNTSGVTNVFMDRNLGATSVAAADVNTLGLLYQWGRKDPFVNASTYAGTTDLPVTGTAITNTGGPTSVATAIANPTYFYYVGLSPNDWNSSPSDLLWGGASYGATKTIFDPCPAGWRVPSWNKTSTSSSPWAGLATYQASYWSTNGFQWTTTPGIGFWPAAGFRYPGSGPLAHVGDTGAYWSASPYSSYGYYFYFISSTVRPEINNYRAYGYSVRCVQEW
jgi:uncharacterized protein (TIGR02145 family)